MPLARPVRSVPQDVVYGIARIDSSGRICERAIITAPCWAGGDRLTFTADAGVVTARRDPGGMVTLPASGYITILAARNACSKRKAISGIARSLRFGDSGGDGDVGRMGVGTGLVLPEAAVRPAARPRLWHPSR